MKIIWVKTDVMEVTSMNTDVMEIARLESDGDKGSEN
jgi:hypothetical protein